jgi:hypothetical protein
MGERGKQFASFVIQRCSASGKGKEAGVGSDPFSPQTGVVKITPGPF